MNKRPTLQYGILGVLLLWALIAQLTYSGYYIYIQATRDRNLPVPFLTADLSTRIEYLPPGYENTGLRVGDDVIALNGERVEGMKQIEELRFELHPGSILRVTVEREEAGVKKTVEIPIVMHTYPSRFLGWTSLLGLNVFLPLSCILVGFYVAFARPRDPLAWITMAMLVSFGDITANGDSWAIWSPWREILFVYHFFVAHSWPVWIILCLLMLLHFPLTMAYVIVVQRAMDVRMVIRTGVKYAIASNGLKVVRIVLTTAIVIATIELASKSGHRYEAASIAILGACVIAGFGHLARRASRWMDRRFFREA